MRKDMGKDILYETMKIVAKQRNIALTLDTHTNQKREQPILFWTLQLNTAALTSLDGVSFHPEMI